MLLRPAERCKPTLPRDLKKTTAQPRHTQQPQRHNSSTYNSTSRFKLCLAFCDSHGVPCVRVYVHNAHQKTHLL